MPTSEAAAEQLRLSLPEAINRAGQRAPELILADLQTQQVAARRAGAGIVLPENPRLNLEARPAVTGGRFIGDMGYAGSVTALFDLGGAPSARIDEVNRDVELAGAIRDIDRIDARLRVFSAYFETQLADLRASEARRGIDLAQRVLDAADKRIDAGAAAEFERASAQVELARVRLQEEAALREHEQYLMTLRDGLDLAQSVDIELTTGIEKPAELPPVATFLQNAEQRHPDLLVIHARRRSLLATRARLNRENFPKLGLIAGVDAAPVSPIFGILGVTGELPVAQRNQGPRAVVARELETEEARLALKQRRISRDIRRAWDAHARRISEYSLLTDAALPAAERSFDLAEGGWRAGRFDWFRVAVAARNLMEVRAARIDALAALWSARVLLARARGGDLP
ncbi:MAG TPA: TolC family protein [Polyangiales bacterium]|nr:TolC family protein [Polyangiales bacterium]